MAEGSVFFEGVEYHLSVEHVDLLDLYARVKDRSSFAEEFGGLYLPLIRMDCTNCVDKTSFTIIDIVEARAAGASEEQ